MSMTESSGNRASAESRQIAVNAYREAGGLEPGIALMHAQAQFEMEKQSLVRILHDDLGSMLVGATMDVRWLSCQSTTPTGILERLSRVIALLNSAIDLKRRLIEELQPSLLQNIGLFAALRWYMKRTCDATGVACVESYPENELALNSATKVAVYRIVQESIDFVLAQQLVSSVSIEIDSNERELHCYITSDQPYVPDTNPAAESLLRTGLHYRALNVGGRFDMDDAPPYRRFGLMVPLLP